MSVFKCKMCGGSLEVQKGQTICECEYCGTKQTVSATDDEVVTNLYNRANNLRIKCEFDKAQEIYEKIVAKNLNEAEAYWGIVLCKYGIEYVEGPKTYKRVPTCHRTQLESVLTDVDYLSAMENADSNQKLIYEQEAKEIDKLQKDILSIVHNEKPFDVFICYKETDENGKRTVDSVLANDIYYQLTQEGLKVFYAAITLENKLGQEYEPYIFSALNSAKVMLVVGTKPENFNAVWVKNEWSRYLKLMSNDCSKTLIPCFRDMDAYDLPDEFSHLQAQDMSKIGFINDVVRGIKKLIAPAKEQPTNTVVVDSNSASVNIEPLLKRMFMFLEDGEWQRADDFAEQVLNQDPENAYAYLGKLMADLKINKQDLLGEYEAGFENNPNYNKIRRYADKSLNDKLDEYIKNIANIKAEKTYQHSVNLMESAVTEKEFLQAANSFESHIDYKDSKKLAIECRNKVAEKTYQHSVKLMESAVTEKEFLQAADSFESHIDYKDSKELATECRNKAVEARKEAIYLTAVYNMKTDDISKLNLAIEFFNKFPDYKDSAEQISVCKSRIEKIKNESERKAEEKLIETKKKKKKVKRTILSVILVLCVLIAFIISLIFFIIPNNKYKAAVEQANDGQIIEAYETFIELNDYKDSGKKASEIYNQYEFEKLKLADVGDKVCFGSYEQDNNFRNGNENIEWVVLEKENESVLLISDKALDCQPYNDTYKNVNWEMCSLRKWINDTFYNTAFNTEEQMKIKDTEVLSDGKSTVDKVFLLSAYEAKSYFADDEKRKCIPTAYAKAQGAFISDSHKPSNGGEPTCWWWLRTSGENQLEAAFVYGEGLISNNGYDVDYKTGCVRPVICLSLENY